MIFGPYFPVPYHFSPLLMSRSARNYKFYNSLKICHQKSRLQRFFALYDFPLLLCFSPLTRGRFRIQQILRNCENRGPNKYFCFAIFRHFLVCLTYQTGVPNLTNSAKMAKNRGRSDFSFLFCFSHFGNCTVCCC